MPTRPLPWWLTWLGASQPPPAAGMPWRRAALPGLAGGCAGLLLLLAVLTQVQFASTAPFTVGRDFGLAGSLARHGLEVEPVPGLGYDGQWYLARAFDPLLRDHDLSAHADNPRYRAGRPLQGWLGWLLAGGRPGAVPVALLAIGPLAVALGCAATALVASAFGRSRWWGLAFGMVPGVPVGVVFAPPSRSPSPWPPSA